MDGVVRSVAGGVDAQPLGGREHRCDRERLRGTAWIGVHGRISRAANGWIGEGSTATYVGSSAAQR